MKYSQPRVVETMIFYYCYSIHIIEASDGQDGLNKAKEEFPDLIISDVMMPGMNGIDFCKTIKKNAETSHIPFLMLTAKEALEAKIEGTQSGADYYFSKPLSMDLLMLTLRNIFSQKQKLKERYSKDHYAEAKEWVPFFKRQGVYRGAAGDH